MQANNDFGIGATFSVNAHGWATAHGPMGLTVRAIKILLADGSHVSASQTENSEIFKAAMGGYGLIGLITELEVEAVPNARYEPKFERKEAMGFGTRFQSAARSFPMAYGRLKIERDNFFTEALLVTYPQTQGEIPPLDLEPSALQSMTRRIFRYQTNNEWAKRRRWDLETKGEPMISGPVSRLNLMNVPVSTVLKQIDMHRTDVIHEYFVSPEKFDDLLII